jgi:hypothetical protein
VLERPFSTAHLTRLARAACPPGGQPFLQAFGYDVRGHAEPFSIPSLPIIGVSTLTLHTIGRFEGHVRMDNRKITQ